MRLDRVYSKHVSMVLRGSLLAMRVAAEIADQRGWFTVATRESLSRRGQKRFFMGKRLAWSGKLLLVVVAYTTAFTVQICYAT